MMDAPKSDHNNVSRRHKKSKRFRNQKNKSQNHSFQQQKSPPVSKPIQSNGKPPQQTSPMKGNGSSFYIVNPPQSKEIFPSDYKLPEDLDLPVYIFDGDEEKTFHNPSNEKEQGKAEESHVLCPLCQYPIKKFYTTLRHPSHDALVHFDCVLRELFHQNKTKLAKDQRIYYIGGGQFAIVKEIRDKRGNIKSFQIIEKIEYEKHE